MLYDTSLSLNRVFVFEFVKCLCIGAPPKDPAQKRFVVSWDFQETRETREFSSQTTTQGLALAEWEVVVVSSAPVSAGDKKIAAAPITLILPT